MLIQYDGTEVRALKRAVRWCGTGADYPMRARIILKKVRAHARAPLSRDLETALVAGLMRDVYGVRKWYMAQSADSAQKMALRIATLHGTSAGNLASAGALFDLVAYWLRRGPAPDPVDFIIPADAARRDNRLFPELMEGEHVD